MCAARLQLAVIRGNEGPSQSSVSLWIGTSTGLDTFFFGLSEGKNGGRQLRSRQPARTLGQGKRQAWINGTPFQNQNLRVYK
jgi:hypothetical protein